MEQHEHVERDVHDAEVQEPRGDEAVPLVVAVREEGLVQPEVELRLGDRATARQRSRILHGNPHEHGDVDRDEHLGDQDRLPGVPVARPGGGVGTARLGTVDALRADGSLDQALVAGGLAAARAVAAALAVGVAVAARNLHGLGGHRCRRRRGRRERHDGRLASGVVRVWCAHRVDDHATGHAGVPPATQG